jgi:ferric-dicitrate binding protein FerR (iron transport regulator)
MTDERQKRLMHEALDDHLPPEALDELYTGLNADPQGATVFERLRTVDRLLKEAPFEGAPQTLALRVLAKIAELRPEQLRRGAGLALALGIGLAALLLLPLMGALGWLLINVLSNPAAAVSTVIGILSSLMGGHWYRTCRRWFRPAR